MPVKTINIPINGLTYLRKNEQTGKAVCEIDIDLLKKINQPSLIDQMVAEARAEYEAGQTKGFTDMDALIADLNS